MLSGWQSRWGLALSLGGLFFVYGLVEELVRQVLGSAVVAVLTGAAAVVVVTAASARIPVQEPPTP